MKIIVEDADGNEFYQNVAISKTNCSLNDDDFVNDNAKYLFGNSFELVEDVLSISSNNYKQFLGKIIHTKYPTKLLNEFSERILKEDAVHPASDGVSDRGDEPA